MTARVTSSSVVTAIVIADSGYRRSIVLVQVAALDGVAAITPLWIMTGAVQVVTDENADPIGRSRTMAAATDAAAATVVATPATSMTPTRTDPVADIAVVIG